MCCICGHTPCAPRCPNAPAVLPRAFCSRCGKSLYNGDRALRTSDNPICPECLDEMDKYEWLDLLGETLETIWEED